MKAVLALTIALLSAHSALACGPNTRCIGLADPNRPLEDMKNCEPLAKVEKIKKAARDSTRAKDSVRRSGEDIEFFEDSCKSYLATPQDTFAIRDVAQKGSRAGDTKIRAREDVQNALKELSEIEGPLEKLGGGACLEDVKKMKPELQKALAALDAKAAAVTGCADVKAPDDRPQWDRADPRACGIAGCEQLPNGKWTPKRLGN
ncbi:MAG: hypothetical protein AB7K68_02480 [Bacteriovoracia bacterium]